MWVSNSCACSWNTSPPMGFPFSTSYDSFCFLLLYFMLSYLIFVSSKPHFPNDTQREGDPEGRGEGKELWRVVVGETIFGVFCMRKESSFNTRKKCKEKSLLQKGWRESGSPTLVELYLYFFVIHSHIHASGYPWTCRQNKNLSKVSARFLRAFCVNKLPHNY